MNSIGTSSIRIRIENKKVYVKQKREDRERESLLPF